MMTADEWNTLYPPGTPVRYHPVGGHQGSVDTHTRSEAWNLPVYNEAIVVVKVNGYSGGVKLKHLEPLVQTEYERLQTEYERGYTDALAAAVEVCRSVLADHERDARELEPDSDDEMIESAMAAVAHVCIERIAAIESQE